MEVAIVGAGISGLGAAYTLVKSGYPKITIYEAQDYIGGRIRSLKHDDGFLELGAQWIHGQENNIVFEMASERDLTTLAESFEGIGYFCTQDGRQIDSSLVNQVIMFLDTIKTSLSNGDYKLDYHPCESVNHLDDHKGCERSDFYRNDQNDFTPAGDVFRASFKKWIDGKKFKSPQDSELCHGIFNWFMKFETIDNSCSSLDQLSVMSYSLYNVCEGVPLNNFKYGYSSLITSLLEDMPQVTIKLNCPVSRIIYPSPDTTNDHTNSNKVSLVFQDGSTVYANHVIVTNSIGFLKHNMDTFFEPQLPTIKRLIISSMGFDVVNKIYLVFEKPFWKPSDLGYQLIWCDDERSNNRQQYPPWVYDISGIDTVTGQPNVLVGWIGGKGAILIEEEDDQSLITIFHSLLRNFLSSVIHHQEIPKPVMIIRTNWYSNNYVRGAYSHRTVAFAKLNVSLDQLTQPITVPYKLKSNDNIETITNLDTVEWPLILFAGEATDEKFFSTTHGALASGVREASRLIQFWNKYKP